MFISSSNYRIAMSNSKKGFDDGSRKGNINQDSKKKFSNKEKQRQNRTRGYELKHAV